MNDIYKNIEEYNTDKKCNFFFFYDTIPDMLNNKTLDSVVTELFIRDIKLNISFAFITQSYFCCAKKY